MLRFSLAVTAVGLLVGFTAAPAAAAPVAVDKKLTFGCPFPLIGEQQMAVEIKTSFDVPAAAGGTLKTAPVEVTVTVPDKATRGLALVGAASIEGTASAGVTLVNGPLTLPLTLPLTVAKTAVPASGTFSPHATGTVPPAQLPNPGHTTLTVGDFSTRLTPKKADGGFTGLGSFTSDCTLDPGQDPVLLDVDLPGVRDDTHRYDVRGETVFKTLGATAPLTGSFTVGTDPAFTASPVFDRAAADFRLFGFLPGTAALQFTADGPQTGEPAGDGFVAHSRLALAIPQVTVLGLPAAGTSCRTSSSLTADLRTGNGFSTAAGGAVTGSYVLPPLTGCGAFTEPLSSQVAGPGNTMTLNLTPASG
jgi:hypothetical protein